jgi:glycosyltransferase involved in cell wall biosynthesis
METVALLLGVQPIRIGGVECFTRELALQLASHGWRLVAIFGGPPTPKVAEFLALPNLSIEVVSSLEFSNLRSLPAVRRILRKYRPRIFHFLFLDFIGPYPWLAKLHSVDRIFFTAQGSNPSDYLPRRSALWKRIASRLINFPLDRAFCVSDYVRQCLVTQNLLPARRFQRIYNAIPLPTLHPQQDAAAAASFRSRFHIPPGRQLVVQVSWIIPEKGIADLIDAAKIVLHRHPRVHFAFVGSGDSIEHFRARVAELGIADSVTFTGLLENPMSEGVFPAADVFCLASRWQEAFGWVIAEAMSFRKPVVATRVGGIVEIIRHGETGFLVPPQDPAALAEAILQLLDHPRRLEMGEAARRDVEQRFDLRHTVRELIEAYAIG